MKNMSRYFAIGALIAFSSFGVFAAAATGNCQEKAVSLTSDGGTAVTLTRLWDSDANDWEDAATAVKDQAGGYWFKVTVPVGSDCVFYIDPATVVSDNGGYFIGIDNVYAEDVYSVFDFYDDPATGTQYWYIRSSDWDEEDSGNVTFYIRIGGDYPGVRCTFYHYCNGGKTIADFASPGSELSPVPIDLSTDGSRVAAASAAAANACWYSARLSAGTRYVFACKPQGTNDTCSISVDLANYDVEYDSSYYLDEETGECVVKVLPYENVDASIVLSASDLTDCTFSWHQTLVGTFGFTAASYTFADTSGVAVATVRRTSNDVTHRLKWMTVAETAQAGVDYTPMSGEIVFDADGDYSADIEIPLVPGADVASGARSFAIRLESIPEDDLAEGEYSPTPSPQVARIFVTPTGEGEPEAELPEAVDEDPETPLAYGTFKGVYEDWGPVSMTVRPDGTVSATFGTGDGAYLFEGDTNEVTFAREINGKLWQMYLSVSLPDGTVEDLATAPCGTARLEGTIFTESCCSDEVVERVVSCELYREESRLDTETLDRMQDKAGRYTLALMPSADIAEYVDEYNGATNNGYLVVNVLPSGETNLSGTLPYEGGEIEPFAATAYDTEYGLAIPFYFEGENGMLAGTLKIGNGGCEILYDYAMPVLVTGGKYDYWTDLERLYNGWVLSADEECVLAGMELSVSGGEFVASDPSMRLTLDRETGVISGTNAHYRFSAVLINCTMSQGALGAVGYAVDAGDNSYPIAFSLDWTDPNWSENWGVSVEVGFEANGASGTAPASITAAIGGTITLPQNPFTRVGYEFGGWIAPSSGNIYAAGEEINVPAEDTNFLAHWIDRRISVALDCNLDFVAENWQVAADDAAEGASCMKGLVQKAAVSGTLSTTVDGAGKLIWRWKLVRRNDWGDPLDDRIALKVDGEVVATLLGADLDEFLSAEYEISASGKHAVVWEYTCPHADWFDNADSAVTAVDCVAWEPISTDTALVTFDPGDGATVSPTSRRVKIGEAIGPLPTPVCDSRDFAGWTNSLGGVATAETVMPKKGLSLGAKWEMKTWTVSFSGGDATSGSVPNPMQGKEGVQIALPSEGTLSKGEDWEFAGWTDSLSIYAAAEEYTVPGSNVTLTAQWADVRIKRALDSDLDFTAENWQVSADASAEGASCMKGLVQKAAVSGTLSTTVDGAGTLTWRWKLVRRNDWGDPFDDRIVLKVDGEAVATLSGGDYGEFLSAEYEIGASGKHVVVWEYTCPHADWIDNADSAVTAVDCVTWEPNSSDYAVVTFDPGEGATVRPAYRRVKIGEVIGTLPTPVCETRDFVCWTNSLGETVTVQTVMPEDDLPLAAKWEMKTWTVSFSGGDATSGSVPNPMQGKEGVQIALPSEGTLSKGDDWEFAGWSDGVSVYAASGAYTVPGSNVTLTAQWADVRIKRALDSDLDFTAENWQVSADASAEGASCMKGLVQKAAVSGTLSTTVDGAGTLTWRWKLVRRNDWGDPFDDRIVLKVDGEAVATLSGGDYGEFLSAEYEIGASGKHVVVWEYTCPRADWIDNADSAVTAVDCVTWTPAAPVDFSEAEVLPTTSPVDLGITNGTFAAESAGSTNLVKLVAWAKKYDITVAEVNGMTFTADPQTTLDKAYLLNCSEAEVDEKAAEFRITGIQVGADGMVTVEPENGSDYGNGHIEVRSSTTVDGEYTTEVKPGNPAALFFKTYLVK